MKFPVRLPGKSDDYPVVLDAVERSLADGFFSLGYGNIADNGRGPVVLGPVIDDFRNDNLFGVAAILAADLVQDQKINIAISANNSAFVRVSASPCGLYSADQIGRASCRERV